MDLFEKILSRLNWGYGSISGLVFSLVTVFVAVVSIVLFFHWRRYGISKAFFAFVEVVYLGVCAILLSIAFFSLN